MIYKTMLSGAENPVLLTLGLEQLLLQGILACE